MNRHPQTRINWDTERDPSERPVAIETKWRKTFGRRAGDGRWEDCDEVSYILTWADGTTDEVHTFRNEWNSILLETTRAKRDAAHKSAGESIACLAAGDKDFSPVRTVRRVA